MSGVLLWVLIVAAVATCAGALVALVVTLRGLRRQLTRQRGAQE